MYDKNDGQVKFLFPFIFYEIFEKNELWFFSENFTKIHIKIV